MLVHNLKYLIKHYRNKKKYDRLRQGTGDYSLKSYDELNAIFIHIPKCAGVTINKTLFGSLGGGHKTVRNYKKIFGPITYYRYFSFAFVRNPYTRLYSSFSFLKKGGFGEKDKQWADKYLSDIYTFEDFTLRWLDEEKMWSKNHFYPQYHFIVDNKNKIGVDFIGRVECFKDDFTYVCNKLNVEPNFPHYNKTERKKSFTDVSSKIIKDKIYSLYKKDFDLLGYSK